MTSELVLRDLWVDWTLHRVRYEARYPIPSILPNPFDIECEDWRNRRNRLNCRENVRNTLGQVAGPARDDGDELSEIKIKIILALFNTDKNILDGEIFYS